MAAKSLAKALARGQTALPGNLPRKKQNIKQNRRK